MSNDRTHLNLGEVIIATQVTTSSMSHRRARNIVFLLAASVGIVMTGFGIIMPVFARRLNEFDSGVQALGLMTMAFALAALLASPPMGALADRIGRRPLVLLALASFVAVNIAFLFAPSTKVFIAIRVVEGALMAGLMPAAMGVVADIIPENERAQRVGIVMGAMGSGLIFGPVIGGVLYDSWGFQAPFIASAVMASVAFAFALILVPETRTREVRRREALRERRSVSPSSPKQESRWASIPRPLYVFGMLLIVDFVIVFEYTFIEPQMLFYFYDVLGWTTVQFGVVVATTGVAIVAGQAVLGRSSDKVGRKPIIVLGALLFTSLPAALASVTWFPLMMLFAATAGLGLALIMPALSAFYIDITSEQHRSRVYGIKSSAASLGGVVGPLLLIGVTELTTPRGVFISAGVILVVTAVLALVVLKEPSRAAGDAPDLEWEWSSRATVAQATLRGIVARARTARQRVA